MTVVSIVLLVGAGFLGRRWLDARAENAQLRAQIAVLKRRIAKRHED